MGFATAAELKAHVVSRNQKAINAADEAVLVYDRLGDSNPYYMLLRAKTDVLMAILPDSKALVPAKHRQHSGEHPFIFEVIA